MQIVTLTGRKLAEAIQLGLVHPVTTPQPPRTVEEHRRRMDEAKARRAARNARRGAQARLEAVRP